MPSLEETVPEPREQPRPARNRGRPDLRLVPAAALAWAVAAASQLGLLPGAAAVPTMLVAMGVACAALVFPLIRPRRRTRGMAVARLAVLPAAAATLVLVQASWATPDSLPGGEGQVEFTVTGDPRRSASGATAIVPARVTMDGATADLTVITGGEGLEWIPGQRFRASARVQGAAFLNSAEPLPGGPSGVQSWRREVRDRLLAASREGPGPGASLLPGLVLGDTRYQDPQLAEDMRTVSMTHLTAVSGSNLAIVSAAVWWLAAWCRLLLRGRAIAAIAAILGYAWLVGPEPSVLRATVMACAVAFGMLRGSMSRGLPVLWAAIIVLLIALPSLSTEPGFLLSVLACAGILLCAGRLAERILPRWPPPLALLVTVPVAAQLFCAPVLVVLNPAVSAWAVPANVVASLAVAPATILGIVAAVAGALHPALAVVPAWCGVLAAGWIAGTAQVAAAAPLAALAWPSGAWGVATMAMLVVTFLLGILLLRFRPAVGLLAVACAAAGTLVAIALAEGKPWPPRDWAVVVCDVGQGSATVIALPEPGRALLIDAGPEPRLLDRCLSALGVRTVDLVLSHNDRDHVAGLAGIGNRTLASAVVSGRREPAAAAVRRGLAERGVAVADGQAGGGGGLGAVAWSFLWPEGPGGADAADSANDASVVVRVDTPSLSVLLPGDIGEEPQSRLAREARPVDVMLAAHHGSADMDERLNAAAEARLGVFSAGADNRYGHPTRRALDAFAPAPALRTDLCGSIAVLADLRIGTERDCLGPGGGGG